MKPSRVVYECGICGCYHPWNWDGGCREDADRFGSPEDYAEAFGIAPLDLDVRSMDERVAADRRVFA